MFLVLFYLITGIIGVCSAIKWMRMKTEFWFFTSLSIWLLIAVVATMDYLVNAIDTKVHLNTI